MIPVARSTLQQQARALGDPTRHAIFRFLVDATGPTGVAALTAHFGLNHNAIRQHLAKLVAAGLVVETRAAPAGRGRPPLQYVVDPAAGSRWGVGDGPYERLSLLLSEVIRSGDTPVEVGRRAGRRAAGTTAAGATDAGGSDADPIATITAAMAREGFEPEVHHVGGRVEIVLHHCPFESTAVADPATVCALHLGLAEGIAEGTRASVERLIPHDPRHAECVLRVRLRDRAPA